MTQDPIARWWHDAIFYQIYPRSFQDSNGDGIGDLAGIISRLDYLKWLGVDGIWLNPITRSPDDDFGYDVSDYMNVQPVLGDLQTLDRLIEAASSRDMRIVLDIVPNHTSDRHPWFEDARSSRQAEHRDWYVWADPRPDGSPPNNWLSGFGGSAWELDAATGQYYLHQFLPSQPDLNWWNPDVRDAFDDVLRFWFGRGVAGFRIDTAHLVIKDEQLRDNPLAGPDVHVAQRRLGQFPLWNSNQPEVHDIWRRWRAVSREYEPERALIGETWVFDPDSLARYYGDDDELHMNFNFLLVLADFAPRALRQVVESTQRSLGEISWPAWTGSNHDVSRFPTRWCEDDPARVRLALVMLLTLRGSPFIYYGDELGRGDVNVPAERAADPLARRFAGQRRSRDPERTPMVWSSEPGAGFTEPSVEPWLPFGDLSLNVEAQEGDPTSTVSLCRDLIRLRRGSADLRAGGYSSVASPEGVWAYRRGSATLIALNFSDRQITMGGERGRVQISSHREHDGALVDGDLVLQPAEGVVIGRLP